MDDDDMSIDPVIAAQMGFSSFGAAPATKKRKYNDASFVEGQKGHSSVPKAPAGSGANNVALGVRPSKADTTYGEDKQAAKESLNTANGTLPQTSPLLQETGPEVGKGKDKGKAKQASGLAAFLSRGQTLPTTRASATTIEEDSTTSASLASRPAASSVDDAVKNLGAQEDTRESSDQVQQHGIEAYRRGVQNETGDMAYFLPSFLEDPWERLRQKAG